MRAASAKNWRGGGYIPVYAGCDAPLVRKLVTAEHVHGKTGLDGVDLPAPTLPLAEGHAVDFLIDTLRPRSARHRPRSCPSAR